MVALNSDVPSERVLMELFQSEYDGEHFLFYLGVSRLGIGEGSACVGDRSAFLHDCSA